MMQYFIRRIGTSIVLVSLFLLVYLMLPPAYLSFMLFAILALIMIFEWPRFFSIRSIPFWLIAPIYPIAPFAIMIYLNQYHPASIAPLFLMVAAFDTGSYIFGSLFGRHLIAPSISPKKSWQGAIGGYLLAAAALELLLYYRVNAFLSLALTMQTSFAVCLLALLGDLFESWLKRRAQIKDSGNLLPGHGGLLDRFDGIMLAALYFYVLATLEALKQ